MNLKKIKVILILFFAFVFISSIKSYADEFTLDKHEINLLHGQECEVVANFQSNVGSIIPQHINVEVIEGEGGCDFEISSNASVQHTKLIYTIKLKPYNYSATKMTKLKITIKGYYSGSDECIVNVYTLSDVFPNLPYFIESGKTISLAPQIQLDSELNIDILKSDEKVITNQGTEYTFNGIGQLIISTKSSNGINYSKSIVSYTCSQFEFDKNEVMINEGETFSLDINTDLDFYNKATWRAYVRINNKDLMYVDSADENYYYNNIKLSKCFLAKKPGEVIISAYPIDESIDKVATCKVIIVRPIKSIDLNSISLELKEGEEYQLNAKITPSDATNKNLQWKSSNEQVAIVDQSGLVKAVGSGLAIITVEGNNYTRDRCTIMVTNEKSNNNIIVTSLPVTSILHIPTNTSFKSIRTEENFPILSLTNYSVDLYSHNGEIKGEDSIIGSKDMIIAKNGEEILTSYTAAVKGDVSGDGQVKVYDAFQILKDTVSNTEIDEVDNIIRDYNDDGDVKIYDAFRFLNVAISQ